MQARGERYFLHEHPARAASRKHQNNAMRFCAMQARGGRYFPHEHPARAASWKHRAVKAVGKMHWVVRVQGLNVPLGDAGTRRLRRRERGAVLREEGDPVADELG